MAESVLREIDFARYQRWFNLLVGHDCPIKIVDAEGAPVWGCEGAADAELGRRLAQAPRENGSGVNRMELAGDTAVFYRPLCQENTATWGWAAVSAPGEGAVEKPLESDRLADALEDLAGGISEDAARISDTLLISEQLAESYEELHLVYAMDEDIRAQLGGDSDLFTKILRSTAKHLNVDVAAYVRPEDNLCIYATSLSKEIPNLDLVMVETRGDLYRFVKSSGETLVLNEAGDKRRAYIFTDMPFRVLACPIRGPSTVDAMMVLLNHMHKRPFSNSDRHLGEVVASRIAGMANSLLLIHNSDKFVVQLAAALIEAVEAKDPYTRGHSERVNFLSMEMGRLLGLEADELVDLHWGSLLHDVGKIGIPDAILCKPSRLTKDEYMFIKVHPERSYEILRHIDQLKGAVPGARHHQEMFDGKGYPHGLKGKRIPLHARIMAVADTYDSITSSRAYRAGRSHEAAMAEIERVSGTQLDPDIIETFKTICAAEPEWLKRFEIRRDKPAAG